MYFDSSPLFQSQDLAVKYQSKIKMLHEMDFAFVISRLNVSNFILTWLLMPQWVIEQDTQDFKKCTDSTWCNR